MDSTLSTPLSNTAATAISADFAPSPLPNLLPPLNRTASLLFLDSSVSGYQQLAAKTIPDVEIHILNSTQDAVTQITQTLLGRSGISSIQVVSHGESGELDFSHSQLTLHNLSNYANQLQSWQGALTDDADILLYGCDVAQGELGKAFVQLLSQLTGADVAASDDHTGNAALAGDWELEVQTGDISTPLAFLPSAMQSYGSVLGNVGFTWANAIDGNGFAYLDRSVTDSAGNVYMAGGFTGTVEFNPGSGSASFTSAGDYDVFVLKLDSESHVVWAKQMGGSGYDEARDLKIGPDDASVYLTGTFSDTVNFGSDLDPASLTSAGGTDVFVAKLDGNGTLGFVEGMGGASDDGADRMAVDANTGSIYLAGHFTGTADLDPGLAESNFTSAGGNDLFITKLTNRGDLLWTQTIGGSGDDVVADIALDSAGNSYTVGSYEGTADFDPSQNTAYLTSAGNQDIFISKLDRDGNALWAKSLGGSSGDRADSLALDSEGNPYISGYFAGSADLDPGVGIANVTSQGLKDAFIAKLDPSGNYVWSTAIGGGGDDEAIGLHIKGHEIYATGFFTGTVTFDSNSPTATLTGNDATPTAFVSKFDTNGTYGWAEAIGGNATTIGFSSIPDSFGNLYTTGYFKGTADFDPGSDTASLTSMGPLGGLFITKWSLLNPVNTAPTLADAEVSLTAMNEDAGAPIGAVGTLVSSLVSLEGNVMDRDRQAKTGIAITAADSRQGQWFYSLDNGSTWLSLGSVSGSNARLLAADAETRIYFQSSANFNGIVAEAIAFRAWDQTDGKNGETADTATSGGSTAFSLRTDTAALSVNAVNDAPTFAVGTNLTVNSNSGAQTIHNWATKMGVGPADEASQAFNFVVSNNNTALFVVQPTIDAAGTLTFTPVARASGVVTIAVFLKDTGGTANGGTDTSPIQTFTITLKPVAYPNDFNGDRTADLFWRNPATGANQIWLLNGPTPTPVDLPSLDANWQLAGTGDFDGNGSNDLLWHNTSTGQNQLWTLDGTTRQAVIKLPTLDASWKVGGISDFDGDGKLDILWHQENTGSTAFWKMDGTSRQSVVQSARLSDLNWKLVGIGDMDGDGDTDLIWSNTVTGQNAYWQMNRMMREAVVYLPTEKAPGWQIAGVQDFDRDHKADLLWHNTATGENRIWKTDGSAPVATIALPPEPNLNWTIADLSDFDGDGDVDIVWRNVSTGENRIWQLEDLTYHATTPLPNQDTVWEAV